LGYEFVYSEVLQAQGRLLRVYIDSEKGISLDDCVFVSNHLTRVLVVEGIEFDRLEVSSPGLDRPLWRIADFERFVGQQCSLRTKIPVGGRKKFIGLIREVRDGLVDLELTDREGVTSIEFANIDRARLVPILQLGGRS